MKNIIKIILFAIFGLNAIVNAGERFGVKRVILGSANELGEFNTVRFDVYNHSNDLQYSINIKVDYDIPYPQAYVFDNGVTAVVWSYDASVDFYNGDEKLYRRSILTNPDIEYERTLHACVENDKLLLVLSDAKRDQALVQLISSSNELMESWTSGYKNIAGIAYSADQNLIVLSGYRFNGKGFDAGSKFYSSGGSLKAEFGNQFRHAKFIEDNFFLGYANQNAFVVNTGLMNKVETYFTSRSDMILDAVYDESGLIVAVSSPPELIEGRWVYDELQLLTISGDRVTETKMIRTGEFRDIELNRISDENQLLIDGRKKLIEE